MDIITKVVNATSAYCILTGYFLGEIRYNYSLDNDTKQNMVKELIKVHTEHPIENSETWVKEWSEEFKEVLAYTNPHRMTQEEIDNLPF
jgi:hypothetical protein